MPGRIRSIKPEILTDEKAAALSHEAWRLWVSMFVLADDAGNLPASPALLAGLVFWGQPADIARALAELVDANLIQLYRVKGQTFASITGFLRHQRINRPSPAKYPPPDSAESHVVLSEDSVSPHVRLTEGSGSGSGSGIRTTTGESEGQNLRAARSRSPLGPAAAQPKAETRKARSAKIRLAGFAPDELDAASRCIAKLNERSGRRFGAPIHLRRVIRLLRDGYTEHQVRLVIWDRASEWLDDPRMERFLRPATLFGPEKFPDYLAEAENAWERSRTHQDARGEATSDPSPLVASLFAKTQD